MSQKNHWEQVYATKPVEKLGWYEPHLRTSLRLIKDLGLAADAPIIDIGGGASALVDDLLHQSLSSGDRYGMQKRKKSKIVQLQLSYL